MFGGWKEDIDRIGDITAERIDHDALDLAHTLVVGAIDRRSLVSRLSCVLLAIMFLRPKSKTSLVPEKKRSGTMSGCGERRSRQSPGHRSGATGIVPDWARHG
jgi:hypothetical protein